MIGIRKLPSSAGARFGKRLINRVLKRILKSSALLGYAQDLLFPAKLESVYHTDLRSVRIRELRLTIPLGISLSLLTSVTDFTLIPDLGIHGLYLRLFSLVPAAYLWYRLAHLSDHRRETGVSFISVCAVSGLLAVAIASRAPASYFAYFTAALGLIFANCVLAVRFRDAIAINSVFVMLIAAFTWTRGHIPSALAFSISLQCAIAAGFSLVVSYKLERSARINYLFTSKETLRRLEAAADRDRYQQISRTDAMTGLANRQHFFTHFARLVQGSYPKDAVVCVMMLDVDHYKSYNDTFGHLEGDRCLQLVASALQAKINGPDDLAARYGGEEFIILLFGITSSMAISVAERVRLAIERLPVSPDNVNTVRRPITISVGLTVVSLRPAPALEDLIAAADRALYTSKQSGRNRWTLS